MRLVLLLNLLPSATLASLPSTLPSAHADAFTNTPYCGNPACVVLLPKAEGNVFPDETWMQKVALEMHLSETAFLVPLSDGPSTYALRWFTPTAEVDLCGHATLAASSVLWEVHNANSKNALTFRTKSGTLTATRDDAGVISLDFPSEPAAAVPTPELPKYTLHLIKALGLDDAADVLWVGRNSIGGPGGGDLIVEVTPSAFARLAPVPSEIARSGSPLECRVLSVTCAGCPSSVPLSPNGAESAAYDFCSRGFAPCVGVDEDPVCGSAHCALGPFWQSKLGKSELLARVASPRGGDVRVAVKGERVTLGGHAVITMTGTLLHTQ